MSHSLEPQILHEWLAPFGLTLETLTVLPHTLQTELLNFFLTDDDAELAENARLGLNLLGWTVGRRAVQEQVPKKLLQALFRLYIDLREPGPAAYVFAHIWPAPEPARVTYFSDLIHLKLARNNLEEAQKALSEMQELYADRFTTFITEGEIFLHQGEHDAARSTFLKGLEVSPFSHRLILNLAAVAVQQDEFEEAAARLDQLEQLYEPGKALPLRAARLWRTLGNPEKAAEITKNYAHYKQQKQAELAGEIQKAHLALEDTDIPSESGSPQLTLIPELARPGEGVPETAYQVLREVFDHEEFRPGQEQVIANILAGKDTLAVLPTGAGKSLCYQLPALLLEKPVLVLSPLISLMKDQFDKLPLALKEHTLIINSSLEPVEAARRLRQLAKPGSSTRLVYAAPERLRQTPFVQALRRGGLGLVVVDEAHCVTMWGNDFRPDYLFIRRALVGQDMPLLAVTATATPQVAAEITRELGRDFKLVRGSVFRSNLGFSVEKVLTKDDQRLIRVAEICQELPGSGIIYTRSREKCEQVADYLRRHKVKARHYHAGMDSESRQQVQESWTAGQTTVIVATIAFGMGIDKPDVRYIIHISPATSLENYMQEAGRAGRDGQPARCIMLYSPGDKSNLARWLREDSQQLDLETLRNVYKVIARRLGRERRWIVPLSEVLAGPYNGYPPPDENVIRIALSLLERAGLLERGFDLPLAGQLSLPLLAPASPIAAEVIEFSRQAGLDSGRPVPLDLVGLAGQLNTDPVELDARLLEWHEAGFINYQPARRELYLELKDAGNDPRSRLEELLARRQAEAEKRLNQLDIYIKTTGCRQAFLAQHFGERLAQRCGVCDNCAATNAGKPARSIPASVSKQPLRPVQTTPTYSSDEITGFILGGLHMITGGDGQVGRSGLVNLLMGRKTAFGTRANNPFKGKLEAFRVKEVESLVEKQVATGMIEEHLAVSSLYGRSYQAIKVSERGHLWLEENNLSIPG